MSKQAIKVLFVYTNTVHGGGETYLLRILDGIDKSKIVPVIAISSRNERLAGDLRKRNMAYAALPDINFLWKNKIAKIFVQLPNFLLLNIMTGWLIAKYRPQVVHAGLFYSGLFSILPAKLLRRRFVWVAHTESDITAYPLLSGFLMRFSDKTISVCHYVIDIAQKAKLPGIEKIKVIYAGLSDDRFETRLEHPMFEMNGFKITRPVVALMARYDESQKGHIYFWEMASFILKRTGNVNFVVAGDPANDTEMLFKERLRVMAKEMGIEKNLFLIGFVKNSVDFFSQIDILVLPSTNEGAPVVVQEAGAAGKPVVAFAVGGVPELIEEGKTGFLIPPRDAKMLAKKTLFLLSDPGLAKKMGEQGREFASRHFRERQFIESYERVFESLAR